MTETDREVQKGLAGIAAGRPDALEGAGLGGAGPERPGLDRRSLALARLAASIALDAPPATYARQVGEALDVGVEPAEMLALLRAISPQIGAAKAIAAAPEIMLALGLTLPDAESERW
ncbi:carboxymuconolactone decarboxylase [Thermoleophilia bacterium SCSIO 60948]|nr:carboxymuconolactone decarboxylase [Thermoleophilia bacterium SCSIO 60948]